MQVLANSAPLIAPTARIVILTGAGISQESGLETFRDPDGIWAKVRVEDVATPEAFARDPDRVHAFYNMRRARHRTSAVVPNAAHAALARLEREWSGDVLVVTQNVDALTNGLAPPGSFTCTARISKCGAMIVVTSYRRKAISPRLTFAPVAAVPAVCGRMWCGSGKCPWRWIASKRRFRCVICSSQSARRAMFIRRPGSSGMSAASVRPIRSN